MVVRLSLQKKLPGPTAELPLPVRSSQPSVTSSQVVLTAEKEATDEGREVEKRQRHPFTQMFSSVLKLH